MSKEYRILPDCVYKALDWLIFNNLLYKDARVNTFARLNTQDVIHIISSQQKQPTQPNDQCIDCSAYMKINDLLRIIRAL